MVSIVIYHLDQNQLGGGFALGYNFQVKIYHREKSSRNSRQELKQRLWRNEADLIVFHDFVKSACLFNSGQSAQALHCSIMSRAHLNQWLIKKILYILAHRPIWLRGWSYYLFSNNCSLYWVDKNYRQRNNKSTYIVTNLYSGHLSRNL